MCKNTMITGYLCNFQYLGYNERKSLYKVKGNWPPSTNSALFTINYGQIIPEQERKPRNFNLFACSSSGGCFNAVHYEIIDAKGNIREFNKNIVQCFKVETESGLFKLI